MSESTITKSKVFKEDINLATGGTAAEESGIRQTSTGGEVTLTKLDASHIKFQTVAKSVEDLIDGGKDVTIKPDDIDAGGDLAVAGSVTFPALTPAGYVKNSVAGLLSTGTIAAVDLPSAINVNKLADGSVTNAEFQYLAGVTSAIQDQLDALTNATGQSFAILQNRQIQNTGGGTATTGSWGIVALNTEYEDANNIVDSASLPAFSLAAGTYRINAVLPFHSTVQLAQCRLYNVTDGAVQQNVGSLDMYSSSDSYTTNDSGVRKHIVGTFTITDTKQFRIEYNCAVTVATTGQGLPANKATEVYAQVSITKIS